MLEDQCLCHGEFAFGSSVDDGTMCGIGACLPCSRSRKGCVRDYGFTTATYVVAAVLIFLALGGRSGQQSAKRAVCYGIFGMDLAGPACRPLKAVACADRGWRAIGWIVAQHVQVTEMPLFIAAIHGLVGFAAVFIGFITHVEMTGS